MHYALYVVLLYLKFKQLKRKNYSIIASATEYFSSDNNSVRWTPQQNSIVYTLSRYVNFSTKTTTALIVAYLLPVKGTMCET